MAILYIYPEGGVSTKEALEAECASIGRARDNTIVLADSHCSSYHAFFERGDQGYLIRDAGSKNGTVVNGRRIKGPVALAEGDEILLGSTTVLYDRPRRPRVTIVDSPAKEAESGTSIPFRTILDQTTAPDKKTTSFVGAQDLREANRILQVVIRVSETLVAHKPLQDLLEDILNLVEANLPMDQCVIMLQAGDQGQLETRAARIRGAWSRDGEIQVSRSIVDMAHERHLAVLISDTAADPRANLNDSIIDKKIRSALCVPIGDEENVIGVLYADRHEMSGSFEAADLRLLTLLASTAAVKIQQARQVEELVQAQKLKRELELAAEIWRGLLPQTLPACEGFGMAARAVPCLQVGGDYYDFMGIGPGRIGVTVADVSGKGVGAALLMASLRAWLRVELLHGNDLAAMASKLDGFVQESSDTHTFITFFFAELDRETGAIRFVNAGHNPPFILGRDGVARDLPATGLGLGMLPGRLYEVGTAAVGPGEILVLYTDGITESRNPKGEEFGAERLAEIVRSEREKDAPTIVDAVFRGLAEFAGCGGPYDDRTLVVVKRAPAVS
jgi:sigma-B regulation protein RsbU (phosphoserine phosphatase)